MKKKQTVSMDIETAQKKQDDELPVVYRGWRVMPFIIGNEVLEKLGIIGALTNLLIYLTTVFNLKSITAATIINVFSGTTNFGTFVAAFLCDSYFGRYKTLGFAIMSCFLGSLVVELTSAVKTLHPPQCQVGSVCKGPTGGQLAFLMLGLGFLVIGAGGIRPCNLPFGADQFNPNTESGKKGINSFFNWYYFVYTLAQMISVTLVVYIQSSVSWTIGLLIPVIFMFVGIVVFFSGSKLYVKVKASGSPMLSISQVIVASIKKRRLTPLKQPSVSLYNNIPAESVNSKLAYTDQFRFLDKAAILAEEDRLNPDGSPADPWRLCSMQQVEELKCLLRITPIWVSVSIYSLAVLQQSTYAIFQALQTDRRLGTSRTFEIPAASFTVFLMLGITSFILLYERFFIPILERITHRKGGITLLQRVGIGILISIFGTLVSAFVEIRRRKIALTKPALGMSKRGAISSMPGFWLIPQLALTGAAEAFADVGQIEFFYKQFPENMRSVSSSLFYCGLGLASYLSSFMISIVHRITENSATGNWLPEDLNKGRLENFYFLIAGIGTINFCCFLAFSKWYKYRKISDNDETEELAAAKH